MSLTLRSAMLADAASVADGKLYVHGGQWDTLATPALPLRHASLALAVVIEVPYDEAFRTHELEVVLDLDGRTVEAARIVGQLQAGHAPTLAPGASTFVPLAFTIQNLELHEAGRYEWVVLLNGEHAGRIPMAVAVRP